MNPTSTRVIFGLDTTVVVLFSVEYILRVRLSCERHSLFEPAPDAEPSSRTDHRPLGLMAAILRLGFQLLRHHRPPLDPSLLHRAPPAGRHRTSQSRRRVISIGISADAIDIAVRPLPLLDSADLPPSPRLPRFPLQQHGHPVRPLLPLSAAIASTVDRPGRLPPGRSRSCASRSNSPKTP
jgi:hypothetical protein